MSSPSSTNSRESHTEQFKELQTAIEGLLMGGWGWKSSWESHDPSEWVRFWGGFGDLANVSVTLQRYCRVERPEGKVDGHIIWLNECVIRLADDIWKELVCIKGTMTCLQGKDATPSAKERVMNDGIGDLEAVLKVYDVAKNACKTVMPFTNAPLFSASTTTGKFPDARYGDVAAYGIGAKGGR